MRNNTLLATAITAAVVSIASLATAAPAPAPEFKAEKCFGVAKAGQNDCQTASSSCAGTSKRDAQGDAWLYVPAGSCERIVGGSAAAK